MANFRSSIHDMPFSLAHVEWGAEAIEHHGGAVEWIVIVDVLSCSTALDASSTVAELVQGTYRMSG